MLENHELRRWRGAPGALCLSTEPDREGRFVGALPLLAGAGSAFWPLVLTPLASAEAEVVDWLGICRGRAGAGVFVEGGFLAILSVQSVSTCTVITIEEEYRGIPLGEPWVIQLTSTPWTCSMFPACDMAAEDESW